MFILRAWATIRMRSVPIRGLPERLPTPLLAIRTRPGSGRRSRGRDARPAGERRRYRGRSPGCARRGRRPPNRERRPPRCGRELSDRERRPPRSSRGPSDRGRRPPSRVRRPPRRSRPPPRRVAACPERSRGPSDRRRRPPDRCRRPPDHRRRLPVRPRRPPDRRRRPGWLRGKPFVPGQRVGDLVPGSLRAHEGVHQWPHPRIGVQRAERQTDNVGILLEVPDERRAAAAAKRATCAGARFVSRDQRFTRREAEVRATHRGTRAKCGAVRFAAHRTMTVQDARQRAADFVANRTAKAASTHHRRILARPAHCRGPIALAGLPCGQCRRLGAFRQAAARASRAGRDPCRCRARHEARSTRRRVQPTAFGRGLCRGRP